MQWDVLIKILVAFLIIAGPAIAKVLKKAQDEANKRKQIEIQKKVEYEMARTGRATIQNPDGSVTEISIGQPQRPPSSNSTSSPAGGIPGMSASPAGESEAKRRLMELARQRRGEFEAMSRGSSRTQAPPTTARPLQTPRGAGPGAGRPMQQPSQQSSQRPLSKKQRQGQQQQQQRAAAERMRAERERASREGVDQGAGHQHSAAEEDAGESVVHRLVSDAPGPASAAIGAGFAGTFKGLKVRNAGGNIEAQVLSDLRRAVILREVLSAPVALRDINED